MTIDMIKSAVIKNIDNRFDLILVASRRARQIQNEERESLIKKNQNKCTVLALQEIRNLCNYEQ